LSADAPPLAEATGAGAALRRSLVLSTCTAITFLYAMTVTIANVSLPQMQGAFAATPDQVAWVVTANLVATAIATPLAGWLVSRVGRRRLCNGCVAGFGAASLACGLADSLEQLVAFRVLQGAFGAPLVPVSQAIVLDTYAKRHHGPVLAIYGMGTIVGPIVAPIVGGYLSETYDWRWVFYLIVPFALLALAGSWLFIRGGEARARVRFEWLGFLLLSATLASLQLMLDRGERADWFDSGEIVAYAGLAALGLYAFVVHSASAERPFLDPRLLADRNFAVGLVLIFVFGMLNFTPMTLLPPMLASVGGYPDSVIGFVLGARGIGTLAAFFAMIFASRMDPRASIVAGFLLQALAGSQLAQLDANAGTADVFWPMALQGFGVGILWVAITMVTFLTLEPARLAEGAAIYHLVRNIGASLYISVSATLAARMARASYAELSRSVSPYNEALALPGSAGGWNAGDPEGLAALAREVMRQATLIGYLDAFVLFVATSLAVLPLVALIRWKR
jgi:DHA2 family multidrug resistance protein